jgi:WD40 repeat protein
MSDERARRVKAMFEAALDAPPESRASVLAGADDDAVRDEVAALLEAHEAKGDFLEGPAIPGLAGRDAEARAREIPGFVVRHALGEGGGGVVYEAEQVRPRRVVALKVARTGARSREGLRRFVEEAETLARMQHPGIAHVYAAGVHEDAGAATPWIAMERVEDARDVVRFAAERRLGLVEKLRLVLPVCEALQYAHEKGVVHRDVKPGNVLVDAGGRPKLVDFGIALRLAAADAGPRDPVGTIGYMSPEQLAGEEGADVRADVYGLGALLYELLAGRLPHDVEGLAPAEAARRLRESPATPLRELVPDAPRDLASIVHKTIAPDRANRYASAAALAEDVRRFLAHEAVAAHDGGAIYHAAKFARRRVGFAVALASVAAALVAVISVSVRAAVESERARRREEFGSYVANVAAAAAALRVDDVAEARRRLDRAPSRLRDWEWRHLRRRCDLSASSVRWAGGGMRHGVVSADGAMVAAVGMRVAGERGDVYSIGLWRTDGALVRSFEPPAPTPARWPLCVALSPDHARLVIGFRGGDVEIEDAATGAGRVASKVHDDAVVDLAFAPRGDVVATASADGSVRLLDAATLASLRTMRGHGDRVISLAFSPDGGRLYSGGREGAIRAWDVSTGEALFALVGHAASVEGVAVSPDGARLASASRDGTVRLWDLAARREIAVRGGHRSNVRDVAFDPSGGTFVSASWDGTLRVWDGATGDERAVLRGHEGLVSSVAFAPGDAPIVSFARDGTWRRWDARRAEVPALRGLSDSVQRIAVHPGGEVAAALGRDGALRLFGVRDARPRSRPAEGVALCGVFFQGPDALVGIRSGDLRPALWRWPTGFDADASPVESPISGPRTSTFVALDPRNGAGRCIYQVSAAPPVASIARFDVMRDALEGVRDVAELVTSFAWDAAADRVAIGTMDGKVLVCGAGRGGRLVERRVHDGRVASVAFDETGARIVSAGQDGVAQILSSADLATIRRLTGHTDAVSGALFLPGARRAVTGSDDRTVRVWDVASGESVLTLHDADYPVTSLAATPDGETILAGAGAMEDARSCVLVWSASN